MGPDRRKVAIKLLDFFGTGTSLEEMTVGGCDKLCFSHCKGCICLFVVAFD